MGEITAEKVQLLQDADHIYIEGLKQHDLYKSVWQAGTILLPVKSVGVMGDERTYEFTVALRAVTSVDGMTADWAHLPYEFLAHISNEIINNVIKHANANTIEVSITSSADSTLFCIKDNGKGFNTEKLTNGTGGIGLQNIINRAKLIGASVEVLSSIGSGTSITLHIKPQMVKI